MALMMASSAFLGLLLMAAVFDVRARRVPNALVLSLLALCLIAGALQLSVAGSLSKASLGVVVGLAVWVPLWLLGMLGAGDVKFFAAAAGWLGPALAWRASLAAAVLGGVLSLGWFVYARGIRDAASFTAFSAANARAVMENARAGDLLEAKRAFPYAVPMAVVLAAAALAPRWF